MKKFICVLLLIGMVVMLGACGGGEAVSVDLGQPEATSEPVAPEVVLEIRELEILEFGYSVRVLSDNYSLYHSIFLYNPNEHVMAMFPSYRITAFAEDGRILGTTESVRDNLLPGSILVWASSAFRVDEFPARVEAEIIPLNQHNWVSNFEAFEPFEIDGASKNARGDTLGQIINNNSQDFERAWAVVVYRDENGVLLGGRSSLVNNIPAMGSTAFSIDRLFNAPDFDGAYSFDVFAFPG